MRHMEANVNDLSDSVAQREATIVSLTSEKAALARVVERLKTAESSMYSSLSCSEDALRQDL